MKLKTLEINGKKIKYEMCYHDSEYGSNTWTKFYIGTTTTLYKKYWFFGEELVKVEPRYVFTIHNNIESEYHTKKEVRGWIERELELLERKEEIKRGEII